MTLSRRAFLTGSAAVAVAAGMPRGAGAAAPVTEVRLQARNGAVDLTGGRSKPTPVWTYNGSVPGPVIRARQGDRLRVLAGNGLDEETTVHWHGLRVPHAMDGVPHLTQAPIPPGGAFAYEFDLPDAGTYWYHPHQRSAEQVGRGLYGALIVEEPEPPEVDRDLVWVLDDWRLEDDGGISPDFLNFMDITHAGRIGNTVTVNGALQESFAVRAGERIRLRLVNAANARIFGLEFEGHEPVIIAIDGQPVAPHAAEGGQVVLGPAMRIDLIVDMTGAPGDRFAVADRFYKRFAYRLLDLVYEDTPLRPRPPEAPVQLAANTMPEPDTDGAERHEIVFGGGMMGGMESAMVGGQRTHIRDMMRGGMAWAINGVAARAHDMEPFLTLKHGRSFILAMANETAWHHPIHLHGHSFRVLSRNGRPTRHREWQDTVLMNPREQVEIAFVADNPGDWMFHCHILEHQAAGMMGVIRVA